MGIKQEKFMYKFGLIGKDIEYSFSRAYFKKKFEAEALPYSYVNFDLKNIDEFLSIINKTEHLKGLNVTIPYKEAVIPYLDKLSRKAKKIGAVNTIKITNKGNGNASNISVEDTLNTNLFYRGATRQPASAPPVGTSGTVSWSIPARAANGGSVDFELTAQMAEAAPAGPIGHTSSGTVDRGTK